MPELSDKTFEDWTFKDAQQALGEALESTVGQTEYETNRKFVVDQDHWQDGATWIGGTGLDEGKRNTILAAVAPQFTPVDVIGEALDRVVNSLMKREADIDFVPVDLEEGEEPTDDQQAAAAKLKATISEWWDRAHFWDAAREAVRSSRWAVRGLLRLWLPKGNLETRESEIDGQVVTVTVLPTASSFEEAFNLIEVSAPLPGEAIVYTDPDTMRQAALFFFKREKKDMVEMWFTDSTTEETVLRILGDGDDQAEEYRVDLLGRLPMLQMKTDLLITEAVRRQQNRLNFTETMISRISETAGFPERYTLNAEAQGIWLQTAPADGPALDMEQDALGRTWYLHQAPRTLGAAITTDLVGIKDTEGADVKRATPGVVFREPTDPDYAIKAARHGRATILESCRQAHILMGDDATASGYSREQARADFEDDLDGTRAAAEPLIRDIIETAIAFAAALAGGKGREALEKFRVMVTLNVNSGPISPDEQNQNNANVKAGTLSVESAIAANGIEDVDAELKRIMESPESQLTKLEKQVKIMALMVAEGAKWQDAARLVGIEDEAMLLIFGRMDVEAAAEAQRRQQELEARSELAGAGAGA